MRIALSQINPTVGDVAGNVRLVADAIDRAVAGGAAVLVLPEMCIAGYPPRDLLLRDGFVESCEQAAQRLARGLPDNLAVIIGHPRRAVRGRRAAHNSASVLQHGEITAVYDKQLLPGYDVFDEDRWFEPGGGTCIISVDSRRVGVLICEDLWQARDVQAGVNLIPREERDPVAVTAQAGCDLLVVLSASPFVIGKGARHIAHLRELATRFSLDIALVNQVGANDDLIFDGRSVVVNSRGEVVHRCAAFEEDHALIDLHEAPSRLIEHDSLEAEVYDALVTGIRDYVRKTRHTRVTIGLSGGIDSALTATLAARALGAENITGVMMPSKHSSMGSIVDAEDLASRLGIDPLMNVPIETAHEVMSGAMRTVLDDRATGVVDENIQARLRGIVLMGISNADGSLVLATGNKSELAMGYCTLYGDMAGAIAPLGDLLKTQVYDLSRWINEHHARCGFDSPPIPQPSLTKPPSAELRPNQTDQDTLPPYEVLDEIVRRCVDDEESAERIVRETGFDRTLVERVVRTIDLNEYKRRQAAVILKVSPRTFGPGRPMPIVMRSRALPRTEGEPDEPVQAARRLERITPAEAQRSGDNMRNL